MLPMFREKEPQYLKRCVPVVKLCCVFCLFLNLLFWHHSSVVNIFYLIEICKINGQNCVSNALKPLIVKCHIGQGHYKCKKYCDALSFGSFTFSFSYIWVWGNILPYLGNCEVVDLYVLHYFIQSLSVMDQNQQKCHSWINNQKEIRLIFQNISLLIYLPRPIAFLSEILHIFILLRSTYYLFYIYIYIYIYTTHTHFINSRNSPNPVFVHGTVVQFTWLRSDIRKSIRVPGKPSSK